MSSLSDWITHTIAFMYSDHVYKVGFWVKMSAGMNYCVFSNVINTSYHRGTNNYLMVPHESNFVETKLPNK